MDTWPTTETLATRLYRTDGAAESVAWDLPAFLSAYTLHDSYLAEARLEPTLGLIVLVGWDVVWNPQVSPEFKNLVIGIPTVYSASWSQGSWQQPALAGATSTLVTADERERMPDDGSVDLRAFQGPRDELSPPFDDATLTRTTFDGMNWSHLRVLHGGSVRLLCMDDDGHAGPLPRRGRS